MNTYELTFLVKPDEKTGEKEAAKVKGWVEAAKGEVKDSQSIGVKDLAYPLAHAREALFWSMVFSTDSVGVGEVERRLRIEPEILRFLLVRPEV